MQNSGGTSSRYCGSRQRARAARRVRCAKTDTDNRNNPPRMGKFSETRKGFSMNNDGWETMIDERIKNIVVSTFRGKQVIHVNYNTGKRYTYTEKDTLPWTVARVLLNVTPETEYINGFGGDVTKREVYKLEK